MRFPFLYSVLFVVLTAFSASPSGNSWAAETGLTAGKQAPAFELRDLGGSTVSLAQFKGKVVLLNFWSTLCAPCVAEMPSLNRLSLSLKEQGLVVLSVAIDSTDGPVRDFAANTKISFPVLVDREKEVFFDDYAGPSLPASYLIDRNGVIVETVSGAREWDSPEMKNKVLSVLERKVKP